MSSRLYIEDNKNFWKEESDLIRKLTLQKDTLKIANPDKPEHWIILKERSLDREIENVKVKMKNKIIISMQNSTHLFDRFYL